MTYFFKKNRTIVVCGRGFTLIELMVTVAIFALMTSLILARYNNFYSGTIFRNLAYDVALTIRQAQTYGISVKAGDASSYSSAFGVNFDRSNSANRKRFSLYSYTNSNTKSLLEKVFNLKNGAYVYSLISYDSAGNQVTLTNADIIFRRPNPDPTICGTDTSAVRSCNYARIQIRLYIPTGSASMYVRVNNVGQITVSAS